MLRDDRVSEIPLPKCILEHVKDASTQFEDFRARQMFFSVTLDMFCEPREAEKEYLGRISEGFFAFHSLGVFGEVRCERRRQLEDTVWLLDSNILIHLLSVGYLPGLGARRCVEWLVKNGIRLFTIDSLFDELKRHLGFAFNLVRNYGEESSDILAAALGGCPRTSFFPRSALFFENNARNTRCIPALIVKKCLDLRKKSYSRTAS